MKMKTANSKWEIIGINIISSDSIFHKIQEAIETGNLEESYLQKVTGHLAPIHVDSKNRVIQFFPG